MTHIAAIHWRVTATNDKQEVTAATVFVRFGDGTEDTVFLSGEPAFVREHLLAHMLRLGTSE